FERARHFFTFSSAAARSIHSSCVMRLSVGSRSFQRETSLHPMCCSSLRVLHELSIDNPIDKHALHDLGCVRVIKNEKDALWYGFNRLPSSTASFQEGPFTRHKTI